MINVNAVASGVDAQERLEKRSLWRNCLGAFVDNAELINRMNLILDRISFWIVATEASSLPTLSLMLYSMDDMVFS